jgi:hypothetical protein
VTSAGEYEFEPVRGLPERLPEGETLLWQGEPRAAALARRAFHVRTLSIYFGVLVAWRAVTAVADGEPLAQAVTGTLWVAAAAAAATGLLGLLAWATARTTVYTITSRRIVMRFGIALPITVNFPFRVVESAGIKMHADGTGDIPLALVPGERVSYVVMWPNVRPWRIARPEPMLRGVPEAARVAETLSHALAAAAGTVPVRTKAAAPEEARHAAVQPLAPATH